MPRLVIQPSARQDLNDILRCIARPSGSRDVAARFVQALRDQCRALARLPGTLGKPRSDLGEDVRSFAVRDYIFAFRHEAGTLRVLSIPEGHKVSTVPNDPT